MKISDLLSPTDVMIDVRASQKGPLLQEFAAMAAANLGLAVEQVTSHLLKREELGSTGTGNGIAIPHARLPGLKRPYGLLAKLKQGDRIRCHRRTGGGRGVRPVAACGSGERSAHRAGAGRPDVEIAGYACAIAGREKCGRAPCRDGLRVAGAGTFMQCDDYFPGNREVIHGTKIFEESFRRRQARNEEAQGRHLEERPFRQDGEEPQAGDRDRTFRGAGQGQEGAEEGQEDSKKRKTAKKRKAKK